MKPGHAQRPTPFHAVLALDPGLSRRIARAIERPDVKVSQVRGPWLVESLRAEPADLVITSEEMLPGPLTTTTRALRDLPHEPTVLLLAGAGARVEPPIDLPLAGISAVLPREPDIENLRRTVRDLAERHRAIGRRRSGPPPSAPPRLPRGTTRSRAMHRVLDMAERVARSDSSVLIRGETGTGKEWLARGIHRASERRDGPFVAVNCAALSATLLESELFGHDRGAFTGAERSRRGHFEMAQGGTIFLDEIGDMPPDLQAKLLRVVEERRVQRLGSEKAVAVDVRILSATHCDLSAEIARQRFRADLFYRLAVVELTLPPLRARRADIPLLARRFVQHNRHRLRHCSVRGVTSEALSLLGQHEWPGNVRELANVVERAVLLAEGSEIGPQDLPPELHDVPPLEGPRFGERLFLDTLPRSRQALLTAFEREYLERLLDANLGRVGATASQAGIDVRTLRDKLKRLGLDRNQFRGVPS